MVETLVNSTYELKHAELDGANEQALSIDKSNSNGPFLYFSFQEGSLIEEVPEAWDLLFCRYTTPLDDGEGGILEYTVTGILSGVNAEVAEVRGLPSEEVGHQTEAEYTNIADEVGYDWKAFDFNEGWILDDSLTYLIKTNDNLVYKIVFVDFEGSSTGTATFEIEDLGTISNIDENRSNPFNFSIFPNLIQSGDAITLALNAKETISDVAIFIHNAQGQLLHRSSSHILPGLNGIQLNHFAFPAGTYFVSVQAGQDQVTQKLIVH